MPFHRPNRLLAFVALLLISVLAACGGSAKATTTPAASATPTRTANAVQATQLVPNASPTIAATPTPLANNLPTGTARATEASRATGAASSVPNANAATPTPLARVTVPSGTTTASTAGTGTTARGTSASSSATNAASGSAPAGTAGPPTTTPVPVTAPRGTTEQFLRTVLAKGDITGYLTPAFKSQAGSDGYKLLGIQPPVQEFTVDSEQLDADGNGATVGATITTASGAIKRGFVLRKQGTSWLIDNVVS